MPPPSCTRRRRRRARSRAARARPCSAAAATTSPQSAPAPTCAVRAAGRSRPRRRRPVRSRIAPASRERGRAVAGALRRDAQAVARGEPHGRRRRRRRGRETTSAGRWSAARFQAWRATSQLVLAGRHDLTGDGVAEGLGVGDGVLAHAGVVADAGFRAIRPPPARRSPGRGVARFRQPGCDGAREPARRTPRAPRLPHILTSQPGSRLACACPRRDEGGNNPNRSRRRLRIPCAARRCPPRRPRSWAGARQAGCLSLRRSSATRRSFCGGTLIAPARHPDRRALPHRAARRAPDLRVYCGRARCGVSAPWCCTRSSASSRCTTTPP